MFSFFVDKAKPLIGQGLARYHTTYHYRMGEEVRFVS